MKRVFSCALCLVLVLSLLAGCNPAEQTPTETTAEAFDPAKLTINGVALEEYVIVYAQDGQFTPKRSNGYLIESGRMKVAANEIRDALEELTGKKLSVVSDEKSERQYEIIVGRADRKAVKNYYKTATWKKESYAYGVFESKLILAGGSSNACYFAGMDFIDACKALPTCDFAAEMVKGEADLIEVACIGDSITDGTGKMADETENDRNQHSYPVYLQKLLGFEYYVGNYGQPGIKMTEYKFDSNFTQSLEAKPDLVIMMLGTNDAGVSNEAWGTKDYNRQYMESAESMLSQYRAQNPEVQMIVMTPPALHPYRDRITDAAQMNREFAAQNQLLLIDMWNASEEAQWVFNDRVHPQGEVYGQLAQVVYDGMKDIIKR